jgi:hypothetical protein
LDRRQEQDLCQDAETVCGKPQMRVVQQSVRHDAVPVEVNNPITRLKSLADAAV